MDNDIGIQQLRYFSALADNKSFTKAARRCLVSQPALSQSIRALETQMKVSLVERRAKGAELTPAGRRFLASCRQVLELLDEARREAVETGQFLTGSVFVGAPPSIGYYQFPAFVERFSKLYPRVEINVRVQGSEIIEAMLEEGELDFGLFCGPLLGPSLDKETLFRENWSLFCGREHPLARKPAPALGELSRHPFATVVQAGSRERSFEGGVFGRRGLPLSTPIRSDDLEAIRRLVLQGRLLAHLPLWMVEEDLKHGDLVDLKVKDFQIASLVRVAYMRGKGFAPAKQKFLDALRKDFRLSRGK